MCAAPKDNHHRLADCLTETQRGHIGDSRAETCDKRHCLVMLGKHHCQTGGEDRSTNVMLNSNWEEMAPVQL